MSSATITCVNQMSISEQVCQGVGSILGTFGCDEKPKYESSANSLRRTLSAVDMSSRVTGQDIEPKNDFAQKQQQQQQGQLDIWSSVLTQKPSSLPPPYIHPLVKKSKSCLSLRSLEICTENLGSESGSDGYPPSSVSLSDTEEEREEINEEEEEAIQEVVVEETKTPELVKVDIKEVVVMNYSKKQSPPLLAPRSFPPPLKSLSKSVVVGGIHMKTHRKDGRLVLEAVTVPTSQNNFNSQRQDGRLVLTFASPISKSKSFDDNGEDVFETDEEVEFDISPDNEIEEPIIEEDEDRIVLEMTSSTRVLQKLQPTGVMNVHRSAMNKFIGLTNNTTLSSLSKNNNFERPMINLGHEVLSRPLPLSASTLAAAPQQTIAAAAVEGSCFNRYEYCWRKETAAIGGICDSHNHQQSLPNANKYTYNSNNNNNSNNLLTSSKNNYYINNSNNLFVKDSITTTTKGGAKDYKELERQNLAEHLIVLPAYCKPEPRRSLVKVWEPQCIATS
ncbi:protein FAF-like, chloroplastic [Papaver somniferum]|uniref:protein FAF-like, chloroplastic n=1 Tax=Papaver somniferum TaxID=3469 RepID=UPI000E704905|nr:protein FAF-like, chloroplastic [Papaver somniferum]